MLSVPRRARASSTNPTGIVDLMIIVASGARFVTSAMTLSTVRVLK
jgi:hypothetical protein